MSNEIRDWFNSQLASKTVEALKRNGFNAYYFKSRSEAIDTVLGLIPENAVIGIGGSITIRELGLPELLSKKGYQVILHDSPGTFENRRRTLLADVFLSSVNALTLDGKLVCLDGVGNRVAALAFGPKKTIVVAGINKLVRSLDEALWRVRNVTAPMNVKRLNRKAPCNLNGLCVDCDSKERLCRILLILEKAPALSDFNVIIVGENLGF
ncbi:MAG: lactate utilization protein [Nitrososphaeria archaeon]|nr:lactate utilization protein [Nitrososphaeria archaeon]